MKDNPGMDPRERLRPHIESLAHSILGYLDDAPSVHVTATSRASLEDDSDPEGSALNDGGIESGRPPPIRHDSAALGATYRRFFKEAITAGMPVHLIEFRFRRGESGWSYDVALETSAAHQALKQARAPLDQEVAQVMIAAAGGDWTHLTFEHRLPAPARLLVIKDRERREVAPPPELAALLQRAFDLYAQYGRELRWPVWRVRGNGTRYDVETRMYYG